MNHSTGQIESKETMSGLLARLPGAKRALFAAYHIGGCSSCAYTDDETLEQVCLRNDLNPEEVVETLRRSEENDQKMRLKPAEVQKRIENGYELFDIRTREEFDAVSIASARYVDQALEAELLASDKGRKMIFCDHRGMHALDKVAWFRGHGFEDVYSIEGGIDAWSLEVDLKLPRYSVDFE